MGKFSQGPGEVFYEAWERLRDLLRQCPHQGIPKCEITQIFYYGLVASNWYLFDGASGGTFMSKYEDEALELIELVAKIATIMWLNPLEDGAFPQREGCWMRRRGRRACFWTRLRSWPRHKTWLWIRLRSDQVVRVSHQ